LPNAPGVDRNPNVRTIDAENHMLNPGAYTRARVRAGSLPLSTKLFQGIGALPDTYKNFAFATFLLFYYNQVLHLPASLASFAIMIALLLDAISDPLVGSLSDNWHSRLGRRHPFMYAAALPLGITLYFTFAPPAGLGETALFLWLTVCAVLVRTAMTFFLVPWSALFAEFSDDYVERTAIVTYRFVVGWTGGVLFTFLVWTLIFPSTPEFTPGHLNPAGYHTFALVLGCVVTAAVLLTTHLTRREIPYLQQPSGPQVAFSLRGVFREVALALTNRSFLVVFVTILIAGAIGGVTGAMAIYMQTYFWGLLPEDLRWFVLAAAGAVIAFVVIVPLQKRFDKKHILLCCIAGNIFDGVFMVSLRLFDVLPANGSPLLVALLIGATTFSALMATMTGIIGVSMIADTLDEQELTTGRRQEGVFSAALSFSGKATSGVGVFVGGLVLQYLLQLPTGSRPATIDPALVLRLGVVAGIIIPLLNLFPFLIVRRYHLTRASYLRIRAELQTRRDQDAAIENAAAGS
jgi:glycoside/pentoside/hexuronide:cation symporter, GPH family